MRFKIIFSIAVCVLSLIRIQAQVCPNVTDINNTNVCGLYGDANGNSFWNWELNNSLDPSYCANWYARTSPSGFLVRMGSPFVNATTGKLQVIADEQDYTKSKGWELLQRRFGCQADVTNPYFVLYNKYSGLLRVFVHLGVSSNYTQLLMTIKGVYNHRPGVLADASVVRLAADKYLNNQAGAADDEIIISLNEAVGSNQWAVAEFYMTLDHNITASAFQNGALQITVYGITSGELKATIKGTSSTSGTPIASGAFKTNTTTGGSNFNFTATGEKLIKYGKSLSDFVTNLRTNADKIYQAYKTSTGFFGSIGDQAKFIFDNTGTTSDFTKALKNSGTFLDGAGKLFKFIGGIFGVMGGSSPSTPVYTSYNLTVEGSITSQVVVQSFVIKIPGTTAPPTNSNNSTYYSCPLGIFNLKETPVLDELQYNRCALYGPGSRGVSKTIKYAAYRVHDPIEVVVNSGAGLTLVSAEAALVAEVTDATSPPQIQIGLLEHPAVRNNYGYMNHMYMDILHNRLELVHIDQDASKYHVVQTPYYDLSCINRANINIHIPALRVYLRVRAKLRRTDNQGEDIYLIKDYECDKIPGNPSDAPWDISSNINATPPYANYTIAPNSNWYQDWWTGFFSSAEKVNHYTASYGDLIISQPEEFKYNHSIETSKVLYPTGPSGYYTTVTNTVAQTTFRAGSYVLLQPKFEAVYGSVFEATTDFGYQNIPCNSSPVYTNYSYPLNCYNSTIVAQRANVGIEPNADSLTLTTGKYLYPNPTSDKVFVSVATSKNIKVELFDMAGRSHPLKHKMLDGKIEIDVSMLADGSYFLRVFEDGQVADHKFIKLK